ncbi:DNA polymerase epsilon catalytic subunit A-like isoform X1 [Oryza glaberrima]|uniref:DNA polymerase epsilon catalytic subunit A-like isoform X1 n=1 Tax=Oryza glaberrima TaxID=4538 RepID=UPI00224C2DE8|nr:DNA polymerase epsilon catalytic subunit A-like isoform X1 [Oryza glaberrima]
MGGGGGGDGRRRRPSAGGGGGGGGRGGGWRSGSSAAKDQRLRLGAEELLESRLGFAPYTDSERRLGWLLTFSPSSWEDEDTGKIYSCVDLYFVSQDGSTFKVKYKFPPYFYAATKDKMELEVEAYLRRRYEGDIADIEIIEKEDLDLKNHLSGLKRKYLKIQFDTVQQLMRVRSDLLHVVEKNEEELNAAEAFESIYGVKRVERPQDYINCIIDLREYDVPYHVRFAIDNDVRCGQWYDVSVSSSDVLLHRREDLLQRAEVHVCAFDIETTKLPLKFPDAEYDTVMMISYMIDGQGYLIINRECVGEDIEDLEYTPKPEFEGHFKVKNVANELDLLKAWFSHMQEVKPGIYVTYNGDFFDWPFLEKRAAHHGIKMNEEIGFQCDNNQGECRAKFSCHLDCFAWVKRDSYLPQGSHGLKAVTKAKLGYDPLEVNPEDMVRFAMEQPQTMASYSVSDAVATYYLYMTYVHPFIFSLATIIPMSPDEVLRKGSGTLCEMLLMVQAFKANIICPNKHQADLEKFYNNRLLESETYIGGHVECLETGVFRSDLPTKFQLEPSACEQLIANLDRDLQYAISVEGKLDIDSVTNYDEVKDAIKQKLVSLRDHPIREECPLIYHLDVAAMYPNIILTNRLQPPSIVTDVDCTACDFNRPGKNCLRTLEWVWRGETYMAKKSDYHHIKRQIESEMIQAGGVTPSKPFLDLSKPEHLLKLKDRLKKYCQKAYKRVVDKPITEVRNAGICMRENSFYVDTVRSFRDRRYEYKGLNKSWKGKLAEAKANGNSIKIQEAQDMVVLYDSLQLAHKCILNSFYGYVMRKGARWYSMEMAGVVTYTGAKIIQNARLLVDKIGKPLELDTDGIWCVLPGSFPENFTFKTNAGKKLTISYPCVMLNVDVARNNTNDQYQTLNDPVNKLYTTHSECSIEFEVDGPYKAMILPASKEEGVLLKKRYAVFNEDGTLAELKGFEIKRRGELKLIKVFQAEVFDRFLHGSTLEECYTAVASVANRWLDLLDNQGIDISDNELLDFISESSTMSKSLVDYGEQKSCAVTTAKRLAEFLGDSMVKDKGLHCQYIVAREPQGTPVSERAIPVAIFETDAEIAKFYLRKWCKISSEASIRSIVDWSYYKQRLSSAIQKIITIPAAMQKISNPVPRVLHPDWLHKKVREKDDRFRQRKLRDMFNPLEKDRGVQNLDGTGDMEDLLTLDGGMRKSHVPNGFGKENKPNDAPSTEAGSKHSKNKQKSITRSNEPLAVHIQNDAADEQVDRSTDYQGWLDAKKRKWKYVREQKKRQRLGAAVTSDGPTNDLFSARNVGQLHGNARNRSTFFQKQELALFRSHWQIIQLASSTLPGHFFAWVVAEGIMFKIPINVPRVFYLNSKAPVTEEFPGRRVKKILPHGRPCFNLIEVVTSEEQFRVEGKKLAAHLAEPDVEGIYETKILPELNAILQIGCVCKVDKSAKRRSIQDGWDLAELQMKTTAECSYLEQTVSFFYLYHSLSEGRGVYVMYFPTSFRIHAVVVNPFRNKELSPSFLEKQYQDACQALGSLHENITFLVDYHTSIDAGSKHVQRMLLDYRQQHPGPVIGVIECPKLQALKSAVRALDDFPCVTIPCNARDNNYQALGWQATAGRTSMQRCAASTQWFNERISLARYAHVPLGNFELDWLLFTADVFFSRALRDQQQVLWISDDGIPDLGGTYEGDTCFADEVIQPALTYPGAYRRVAVELKIHHLAVNSLLKSSQVDEMEGGPIGSFANDMPAGPNGTETEFDDATLCLPAFQVLKQLIQRCISDAVSSGNVFADAILQHLYRWLCSPRSKLHDPALHRLLHNVMKKVFALMLAEFRKLGANVIFANFSKIIIDTGKVDLSSARAYCDSLLKTLQTRDIFEWVELEPLHYWHSLLFMDQYNYGGIQANMQNATSEGSSDGDNDIDIVSSWNIAEYLPKATQDHFVLIVSEFLYVPWKYMKEQVALRSTTRDETSCTPSITIMAAENLEVQVIGYLRDQISNYFADKLLRIVSDILHHFKGKGKSESVELTNREPDPHTHKGDAALEFIKHICAVLALDQNVQHDILRMRKNLLKLVRVKEFAPEAQFQDPCASFTLPNVICSYCNDCRDLDLCRDSTLQGQEWRCAVPQCGQPYHREQMENALLQVVRQRERLYHLQDLVCLRCRQVKAAHLSEQCSCGGAFRCKEESSQFLSKMRVFLNVAVSQKFELLQDVVQWILEIYCHQKKLMPI